MTRFHSQVEVGGHRFAAQRLCNHQIRFQILLHGRRSGNPSILRVDHKTLRKLGRHTEVGIAYRVSGNQFGHLHVLENGHTLVGKRILILRNDRRNKIQRLNHPLLIIGHKVLKLELVEGQVVAEVDASSVTLTRVRDARHLLQQLPLIVSVATVEVESANAATHTIVGVLNLHRIHPLTSIVIQCQEEGVGVVTLPCDHLLVVDDERVLWISVDSITGCREVVDVRLHVHHWTYHRIENRLLLALCVLSDQSDRNYVISDSQILCRLSTRCIIGLPGNRDHAIQWLVVRSLRKRFI